LDLDLDVCLPEEGIQIEGAENIWTEKGESNSRPEKIP
jgi:hypothetical protein